jgi:hypothetical protein
MRKIRRGGREREREREKFLDIDHTNSYCLLAGTMVMNIIRLFYIIARLKLSTV